MATDDKPVMVVALDESEHSYYALQWTLDRFFSHAAAFRLVLVHARPSATSVVGLSVAGHGAADVMPFVEEDLRKTSGRVMEKAKEICKGKSVNEFHCEVMEGDARNVLCDAVEKFHADMLVLGSHGYGAIRRAVLGSVSDYCAHHAHCTVMIVKRPKHKH